MRPVWALALLLATPAWAEGFAARSLGPADSAEACTGKATRVLEAHLAAQGGDEVLPTPNAVYGWDFLPGEGDVMLMCGTIEGAGVRATLVVHSEGSEKDRNALADAIATLWAQP
jgi:hypothetical protein